MSTGIPCNSGVRDIKIISRLRWLVKLAPLRIVMRFGWPECPQNIKFRTRNCFGCGISVLRWSSALASLSWSDGSEGDSTEILGRSRGSVGVEGAGRGSVGVKGGRGAAGAGSGAAGEVDFPSLPRRNLGKDSFVLSLFHLSPSFLDEGPGGWRLITEMLYGRTWRG